MSLLEEIKAFKEKIERILPENIVHFSDELVEIQIEAIHKTLDCADKYEIDHSDALCALVSGLKGSFEHFDFNNYEFLKCAAENTCKDTEQDSWKESVMKHFVEGE